MRPELFRAGVPGTVRTHDVSPMVGRPTPGGFLAEVGKEQMLCVGGKGGGSSPSQW
jgi:hypothetical protein